MASRTPFVMDPTAPERKDTATYGKAMFESQTFAPWDEMFKVNVSSIFFVTFAFLGLLEESTKAKEGATASVINISSAVAEMKISHSLVSRPRNFPPAVRALMHPSIWHSLGIHRPKLLPFT